MLLQFSNFVLLLSYRYKRLSKCFTVPKSSHMNVASTNIVGVIDIESRAEIRAPLVTNHTSSYDVRYIHEMSVIYSHLHGTVGLMNSVYKFPVLLAALWISIVTICVLYYWLYTVPGIQHSHKVY
jgi:hypothetical protein